MWIFLSTFLLVITVWGTYLGFRLIRPLQLSTSWTWILWSLLYLPVLIPLVFTLRRTLENDLLNQALEIVVFVPLAFYSFLLGLTIFRDITALLLLLLSKVLGRPDLALFSFGQNLKASSLTIIGASVLMIFLGLYNALSIPEIKEVTVPINNLHPDLQGFKIVQLTDLHADDLKTRNFFAAVTEKVSEIQPDLTVITGDLADGSMEKSRTDIEPLRSLPEETYFITGNHEYYTDYHNWLSHLQSFGFKILLDQHDLIKKGSARILIAGVTDPASKNIFPGRPRGVTEATRGAPDTDLQILLAHQPREIHEAAEFGFDLQLSGHTHGGQLFPWNYVINFFHPYARGLHQHQGTWIYVSQGTGFWGPPIRLGTRSEITLLTLTRGDGTGE